MDFGEKVRTERELELLSPREVSEKVDLHVTYIRNIEKGVQTPSARTALKIAQAFDPTASLLSPRVLSWNEETFEFGSSYKGQRHNNKENM